MDIRTTIRHTARLYLLGFTLLALVAGYWHLYGSLTLARDPGLNAARLQGQQARVHRGRILLSVGGTAAETNAEGDRVYPRGGLAHLLGYYSFRYGLSGVEEIANAQLSGEAGLQALPGVVQDLLHLPRSGSDVTLTIDGDLQGAASEALGERPGAIVVLDVKTGAVLAMVSRPRYDPGRIDEDFAALRDDPSKPLLNRATQGLYPPGSTFKTVTLAGLLQNGVEQPNTDMDCPAEIKVQGATITSHNEPKSGGGTHDVTSAYQWSCNTAFARMGIKLGAGRLRSTMQAFGFGEAIPFDGLPVAASQWEVTSGFLDQDDVSVAATAFGQGELLVTPMQMALVVAAVANDGRVPQPFVIPGPLKGLVPWRVALDAGMARQVAEIMRVSGRDGWARSASTPAIPVAGKTGTAEAPPGAPHAWYIGFAPADAPVVAFAVVVENGGEGSSVAAPVVAQMLAGWGKLGK